jgi:hypothetical protein
LIALVRHFMPIDGLDHLRRQRQQGLARRVNEGARVLYERRRQHGTGTDQKSTSLAAAVDVAIQAAIELVDETIKHDGGAILVAIIVTDQDGKTLATVSILDVLRKRRRDG